MSCERGSGANFDKDNQDPMQDFSYWRLTAVIGLLQDLVIAPPQECEQFPSVDRKFPRPTSIIQEIGER